MFIVAIDFGGTYIKMALLEDGMVRERYKIPAYSDQGLHFRLEEVKQGVHLLLEKAGLSLSDCSGIGMAIPGIVNADTCRVLSVNAKYNDAIDFDFAAWAEQTFGLPIVLENDAKAALIGEVTYGVAAGETDAVLMTFGTGIGTAAIVGGRILRGKHHQAGCLGGHFVTDAHGPACNCGGIGCLEANAGNWSLPRLARRYEGFAASALARAETIDYKAVIDASLRRDPVAETMLRDLLEHWTAGILNLIHAYDPEVVILSGGLMKSRDVVLPIFERKVHERAWTPWGKVRFAVAEDPETSVLLGVFALLKDKITGKD